MQLPGEILTLGSNRPFALSDGSAWFVTKGEVDVFAVRMANGVATGRRMHLVRVEAGGALFGARGVDGWHLLAVGTSGSTVERVLANSLTQLPSAELTAAVELWVEALQAGVAVGLVPQCLELDGSGEEPLAVGQSVRARSGVLWVHHLDGHSHFLGRHALVVNGNRWTPMSNRAWLSASEPSRLAFSPTSAISATPALWDGLESLHDLVLRSAAELAGESAERDRERLVRTVGVKRQALADACGRLLRAVQPDDDVPTAGVQTGATGDGVPAAARIVGKALGVDITATDPDVSTQAERTTGSAAVIAIAQASRLRTRTVLLRDDWWHHDHGPLVAFRVSGAACALLPHADSFGRCSYTLHEPGSDAKRPVTAAEAESLEPLAHSLYRPFPDGPLGALDLVRFGLRGCGTDVRRVAMVAVLTSLLAQAPPIATGVVFNSVIPSADRNLLLQLTVVLIAAAVANSMFQIVRSIAMLRIETRMGASVQAAVWDRLLKLPMPFFRDYAAGDLAVRAMGIDNIRQLISSSTMSALFGGLSGVFSFGLMFVYSPALAWRGAALIAMTIGLSVAGGLVQLKSQRAVSRSNAKTLGLVLQLLSAVGKIRVAGAEVHAFAAWARRFSDQRLAQYRVRTSATFVQTFMAAVPLLGLMLLFWSEGGTANGPGEGLSTGNFLAFLAAFTAASGALVATCSALVAVLNVLPLYELSRPILQTAPEDNAAKSHPGTLKGQIELQRVSFRYAADGPPTLRDVTLRIEPGQFVAFVGPSGSGKSTLLRLLLGFETPETGVVYYDGQDLAGLDITAVRRQIGAVLQNGRLRSGDIFTNIVGSAPVGIDVAWEAARMAGVEEDIRAMPMGMHTVVSEGGGTLSGGQRQRLLIARALVHRPRLIFFDEATSALDNRTQAIVSASLNQIQATRVVIAHRLSTILHADRIVVVERGRVVQSGTFDELMAQPGTFAELARRQLA